MMDFYLKHNGGQPQVMGVHDEHHLFPFNSFDSLEEMKKSFTWFDDEAVPEGFKAADLLHFAYDPGSGNYALSLRAEDLWQGVFLCFRRKSWDLWSMGFFWGIFELFCWRVRQRKGDGMRKHQRTFTRADNRAEACGKLSSDDFCLYAKEYGELRINSLYWV